jgi:hypothetical protein
LREHLPRDAHLEHEQDARERGSVVESRPAALGLGRFLREERFDDRPKFVGNEWFRHGLMLLDPKVLLGVLNAKTLTRHTFADGGPHSWHEIIPAGALKTQNNELHLSVPTDGVISKDDSVTFSDVVILYRSNKLTVKRPSVLCWT